MIDSGRTIPVAGADQDSSKVIHPTNTYGNDKPVTLEIELGLELTDDEKIDIIARKILTKFRPAFTELAK